MIHQTRLFDGEPFVMKEPKSARDRAQFKNKIPFSEDMYNVLRRAIELLSRRVEVGAGPLPLDDALWLHKAVDDIIEDAKKFGPPQKPPRVVEN